MALALNDPRPLVSSLLALVPGDQEAPSRLGFQHPPSVYALTTTTEAVHYNFTLFHFLRFFGIV